MKQTDPYLDLEGNPIGLADLDAEERRLLTRLRRRARTRPDWNDFDHYWMHAVAHFYDARGMSRAASRKTAVYRVAQDLSSRLAVAAGLARPPDYRDQLDELIQKHFTSRRAFGEAAGLLEDLLSHGLAGRKHLSLETLSRTLARIGYRLQFTPASRQKHTG